jgi:excisionase family DNA binding protein
MPGMTIKEASVTLSVSVRTIHRYIQKGLLEAEKVDGKIYVSEESIRHFESLSSDKIDTSAGQFDITRHVVIERDRYEGLLTRLSQLEAERLYLLEYKGMTQAKDNELIEVKADLKSVQALKLELEERCRRLEDERNATMTSVQSPCPVPGPAPHAPTMIGIDEFAPSSQPWWTSPGVRSSFWKRLFGK